MMSKTFGTLEGNPIWIRFDTDNGKYINVEVEIGEKKYRWDDLSSLHQEQVKREIDRNWVDCL